MKAALLRWRQRLRTLRRPARAWSVAPFVIATTVLGRSGQNVAQTTYPLVGRELLDLPGGIIGMLAAAAGVASILASVLLAGRSTERTRMVVLTIGQGLGLVAFVLFALPTGVLGIWLGAVSLGVGGGIVFPTLMTVVGTGRRDERAKALSVFALALSASLIAGPLIEAGTLHVLHNSLRSTFGALLPLPVAATLISGYLVLDHGRAVPGTAASAPRSVASGTPGASGTPSASRPPPEPSAQTARRGGAMASETTTDLRPAVEIPSGGSQPPDPTKAVLPSLGLPSPGPDPSAASPAATLPLPAATRWSERPVAERSAFWTSVLTMVMYQAPFVALLAFGGLLARYSDHASATVIELAFGFFFTLSFGVRWMVSRHAPVVRKNLALAVSASATVAGIAVLSSVPGIAAFFIGMAILGIPHGLTFPLSSSILAEATPSKDLARANGRLVAFSNVMTVVVPFACGWLAENVGYRMMFLLLEIPVGGFALVLYALLRRSPLPPPPSARATGVEYHP
ncbi:MAG: MFS transporter [Actinomycetota bacterium]|nr:MFS transporter [Actinomycetota bacterium]